MICLRRCEVAFLNRDLASPEKPSVAECPPSPSRGRRRISFSDAPEKVLMQTFLDEDRVHYGRV